eukprot:GHVU01042917.1.p1 GENE.GHVU01042917.1~~GHVU01042917.1.p1  ORF type:complete len:130 (+),score=9.70 GHVU01042917.1:96-485(+)
MVIMTISVFLTKFRTMIRQPQRHLEELATLLEDNGQWIMDNRREIHDDLTRGDMIGIHEVITYIRQAESSTSEVFFQAAFWLYHTLLNFTVVSGDFKKLLCETNTLEHISKHLANLQPIYRQNMVGVHM